MPHVRPAATLSEEERRKALDILSFGAGPEGLETLLEVLVLPAQGNGDARAKAARRTRIYKVRQILRNAPASEHVMAACGYIMLEALAKLSPAAAARAQLLTLLNEVGFDREEASQALARLTEGVTERKNSWKTRVQQQRAARLAAAIRETAIKKEANTT